MAASNDMLCFSYKSVWVGAIEDMKKKFLVVIL